MTTASIEAAWSPALLKGLRFMPVHDLQAGPDAGTVQVYSNYFWVIHPSLGAMFYSHPNRRTRSSGIGSPQCNPYEAIATKIRDDQFPGAQVIKIRKGFVPIDVADYR